MQNNTPQPIVYGILASAGLLGVYFSVLTLLSGWSFAQSQFASYWYFIVSLAVGFGIQVGSYIYLRQLTTRGSGKMLGVTGATSTAAMISCCAHYAANVIPILGTVGLVNFATVYQKEFFSVGILFNFAGIGYLTRKVVLIKRTQPVSTI